jgi:hypothetical protein
MKKSLLIFTLIVLAFQSNLLLAITKNNWYEKSRFGLFVHYVPGLSIYPVGGSSSDINVVANNFNVKQLAVDAQAFGMEYVILTAWHAKMRPIYPSAVTEKWRPGNSSTRDCIRDLINELKPKGIKLILYVHSTDGFEFPAAELAATGWGDSTAHYLKWNNYVSELLTETGNRYGTDLAGFWLDMTMSADYKNMIDKPRIRQSLLSGNPDRVLIGNGSNLQDGMDYSCWENYPSGAVSTWKGSSKQIALLAGSKSNTYGWWACTKQGTWGARLTPENLYRFTVLQAAVNYDGGMAWAASPYIGGGWEDGVKEMFTGCANYMKEVDGSLKGTLPSSSFPTISSKTIATVNNGIVATKSADDKYEYIHVLNVPSSKILSLAAPADGKKFSEALYMNSGNLVALNQTASNLTIELPATEQWDTVNSVIRLTVSNYVAPTNYFILNNNDTIIKYVGAKWISSTSRGMGDYKDDVAATTVNGEYFTFTFEGDGFDYIAPKGTSYGNVEIFIDGVSKGQFSQYAATYTVQQSIYSNKTLPYGTHTVKGVKMGSSYCQVDAIKIYQNNPSAVSIPKQTISFSAFCNDTNNQLYFQSEKLDQIKSASIYNMAGKLMQKSTSDLSNRQMNVKCLIAGMYIALVKFNDDSFERCKFEKK